MNAEKLEQKLIGVLDMQEVKAVAHRFARGLDRCDRQIIESCFHKDGMDDHGFFKGSATEFCDWVMKELEKFTISQHLITTQNAEINGNSAMCESYFYAYHLMSTPNGDKDVIAAGRYLDTMEKRDGEWKITLRQATFDWNKITDAAPLPAPENDPRTVGTNSKEDASYAAFANIRK
ncbi:MAG: nuclear transport factor 2 family protein [Porticoccaceae bacterium]|jgi:hypothetical protein|nr:nuclear transport factor 2 family protein [Porticoccaceae bacterium]